ncbi:hypothetical protein [uncultured Porphyromonas sp.]|nr:hypothetical protein [uncultured Porphyromonas sp.]
MADYFSSHPQPKAPHLLHDLSLRLSVRQIEALRQVSLVADVLFQ